MSEISKRFYATLCKWFLEIGLLAFCLCVGLLVRVRDFLQSCLFYALRCWYWLRSLCGLGQRRFYRATKAQLVSDFALKQLSDSDAHHKAKPDWVKPELLRLMAHMPKASVRLLAMTFNRLHLACTGVSVGRSYVYEYRLRCVYDIAVARRAMKSRLPIEYSLNHTWGLDLTRKQVIGEGGMQINHYILGLIDHGSRLLLALTPLRSKHSWRLGWCVALAVAKYGKPSFIKTDNDVVFTSRLFKTCLLALGVKHKRTQIMSPWQNGRIERLFGTLKQSLDLLDVPSFTALTNLMLSFRYFYNEVRPHQAIGGLTPRETWNGHSWQDVCTKPCKTVTPYTTWNGLLTGFVTTR